MPHAHSFAHINNKYGPNSTVSLYVEIGPLPIFVLLIDIDI